MHETRATAPSNNQDYNIQANYLITMIRLQKRHDARIEQAILAAATAIDEEEQLLYHEPQELQDRMSSEETDEVQPDDEHEYHDSGNVDGSES